MNSIRKGFTLVEILIVVIILGILAAIVIPQFTEASNDARESALASDLQTLRSQVELYKIQHLDTPPGAGEGGVVDPGDFVTCLTTKTDKQGAAGGNLGPYLQKMPSNPFADAATANTVSVEDNYTAAAAAADGSTGWIFISDTGQIIPGTAAHTGM
jgi:general secretion pathway protein G